MALSGEVESLRPREAKVRVKVTAGSVDNFTNRVGAKGSGIFFWCAAAIRERPRETRDVALRLGAAAEALSLIDLRFSGSAKETCCRLEGRFPESGALDEEPGELPVLDIAALDGFARARVFCNAAIP